MVKGISEAEVWIRFDKRLLHFALHCAQYITKVNRSVLITDC